MMRALEIPADSNFRKIVCIDRKFFLKRIDEVLATQVPVVGRRSVPASPAAIRKIHDLTNMMGVFNKCTKTPHCTDNSWWNPRPITPPSPLPLALVAGAFAAAVGFQDNLVQIPHRKRGDFTVEQDGFIREAVTVSYDVKGNIQWKLKAYPYLMRECPDCEITMDQMKARFKTLQNQDAGGCDKRKTKRQRQEEQEVAQETEEEQAAGWDAEQFSPEEVEMEEDQEEGEEDGSEDEDESEDGSDNGQGGLFNDVWDSDQESREEESDSEMEEDSQSVDSEAVTEGSEMQEGDQGTLDDSSESETDASEANSAADTVQVRV